MLDVLRKISLPPRSRQSVDDWLRRLNQWPFVRLVIHFLTRLAAGGGQSDGASFEFGASHLLALLFGPGAICSMVLFEKYSTLQDFIMVRKASNIDPMSAPDKYFFICLAMAVAGAITVIKWDKILPDAQDYLNLAPLPLSRRTVVAANAAAIVIAVLVFAVDVNAGSTILFPPIAGSTRIGALERSRCSPRRMPSV